MKRHRETLREAAATLERTAPLDYGEAIDHTMMHRPEYSDLYGMEPCEMFFRQDVFADATFAHPPTRHTFAQT